MATRPLEMSEYQEILRLAIEGFDYEAVETDERNKNRTVGEVAVKHFRPNKALALALQLQASLGLRIGDVLKLTVGSFKNGKMEILEEKTDKLQYRDINAEVYNHITDYALENGLSKSDKLIGLGVRAIQKQLKIITNHLDLDNISTHSFRKMYATLIYKQSGNNIELVKELLNHSSVAITQAYIRVNEDEINKASASVNLLYKG